MHVYKDKWTPYNGEKLECEPDSREEASHFDKNAIGVYKKVDADKDLLVGHIPMELSFLLKCFLDSDKGNGIIAEVTGHRMRENGLVVPCCYRARSRNLKISDTLFQDLKNASSLCTHININVLIEGRGAYSRGRLFIIVLLRGGGGGGGGCAKSRNYGKSLQTFTMQIQHKM